jgi:hypothetical protein
MNKIDSLVKKAIMFEKLALYGSRKSFLEALAQDTILPQESVESTQTSIQLLNDAANKLMQLNVGRYAQLPAESTIDKIEEFLNMLMGETNKAVAAGKKEAYPIRSQLMSAKTSIDKAKQWKSQQQSAMSTPRQKSPFEIAQETVGTIKPEDYGYFVDQDKKPEVKPATDLNSLFNFYYAKLNESKSKPDFKGMLSYSTKLQNIIDQLKQKVGDNPYAPEAGMIDKGTALLTAVKQQTGEA